MSSRQAPFPPLTLITDPYYPDEHMLDVAERVARALPPRALIVQLRDKVRGANERRHFFQALRSRLTQGEVRILMNADVDLAAEVDADGVHLGRSARSVPEARARLAQSSLRHSRAGERIVTVSAHNDDDVRSVAGAEVQAVLVSPIFDSAPKDGGPMKEGRGISALLSARRLVGGAAVVALGGVTSANARACRDAGAHGVAVIRAVWEAADPADEAMRLVEPFYASIGPSSSPD